MGDSSMQGFIANTSLARFDIVLIQNFRFIGLKSDFDFTLIFESHVTFTYMSMLTWNFHVVYIFI